MQYIYYLTLKKDVLEVLEEMQEATTSDIYWRLKENGERVSREWVLRVLKEYEKKGIVKCEKIKLNGDFGVTTYKWIYGGENHD